MLAKGQCSCGRAEFTVELPQPIANYHPRECDCDFCVKRSIQYVSDPDGILFLQKKQLKHSSKQGDELAEFVECPLCDDVIAVVYRSREHQKAAANATLLADYSKFSEPVAVSPKMLDSKEKVSRWQSLWFDLVFE